jgi:hypothetical protein
VKKGDNNQLKQAPWWPLIVALLVVTAAWMISWFVIQSQYTTGTDRGTFGDMFGAVNALFSGFAFAGLGYAIYLQRQELADTRKSLLDQKQDAKIQNDSLVRQSFENVFFQLLRQHSELIGTLSVKQKGQLEIGRRCFEEWFLDLVRRYQIKSDNTLGSIEIVKQVLQEIDPALEQSTGHYFMWYLAFC